MVFEELRAAVEAAPIHALGEVLKGVWSAMGADLLTEDQATQLQAVADARRLAGRAAPQKLALAVAAAQLVAQVAPATPAEPAAPSVPKLPPERGRGRDGSRPRSADSRMRTRRWVLAGYLPPRIGDTFTQGEVAVLAVVAAEVARRGRCILTHGAIAALAGVSDTTVKRAIKQARLMGLLKVEVRRVAWNRNEANVVTIVCKAWAAWLRFRTHPGKPSWGGGQMAPRTNTGSSRPAALAPAEAGGPARANRANPPRQRGAAA